MTLVDAFYQNVIYMSIRFLKLIHRNFDYQRLTVCFDE